MSEIRPFEEYKEMIQDMSKEEMIKGLYDLSARVIKQGNIIKEVREYIEEKEKDDDNWIDYELCIEPAVIKEILEKEVISNE